MVKFRVTETSNGNFENAEGSLPFDIAGLGPEGATVRVQVWNSGTGASTVTPPYNVVLPEITGTPNVGQVLSLVGDDWNGAVDFNYWWFVDGVQVATSATYTVVTGDRAKTITAEKQAQGVGGSAPSSIVQAIASVYVPSSGGDGALLPDEYFFREATADVETRKTYVEIYDTPPVGLEWIIYRGANPAGDLATVAVPIFDGTKYVWTSGGTALVGTGPAGRTASYVRIGLREIAVPTNKYFVTPTGAFFSATSIPGAPSVSLASGAGQSEIYATINTAADGAGRPITGYQYQIDGGAWQTLAGGAGTGQRTINVGAPTTTYAISVRAVNVNGNGIATAPVSATSGSVSVVPLAFGSGDWSLTDKPSATGNTVTVGFTTLPSSGGSAITDVQYQVNAGAWVSLGTTPTSVDLTVPATTLVNIQIRAVNAVGNGATATKSLTPTAIAAASTIAYFGAETFANAGSWRPETTLGDEVTLTGIVSQAGMTRTWGIVSGALVCTNGTPAVDNTKTLTVSTAAGNIVVTISTVADAWSVANATELGTALATAFATPASVLLRPRLYDMGRGVGSATPSGLGVLAYRTFTATNRRTMDKHPGQVKKPWSIDTVTRLTDTAYLTLRNFKSMVTVSSPDYFLQVNKGNTLGTNNITIQFCDFAGPEIPAADLMDPTLWPKGYQGAMHPGLGMSLSNGSTWNTVVEDCTFRNMWTGGDYAIRGNFSFQRNTLYNAYYDGFRITAFDDNGEPKVIADNRAEKFFGLGDEMSYLDANGVRQNLAPHCDFIQLIGGTLRNALYMRNICVLGKPIRSNTLQALFCNGSTSRCVFYQNVVSNRDSPWGLCLPGADYCVITNNTIIPSDLGSCYIRLGTTTRGTGEQTIQNTVMRGTPGGSSPYDLKGLAADALFVTNISSYISNGFDMTPNYNWPSEPETTEQLMAYATPKVGSPVEALSAGALNTSGGWREDQWPPLAGAKPTLANAGADLLITPSVSKLAHTTPTTWDIKYRNADGTAWTSVTGRTGADYTLVAPNKTGIQVMCRWIGTNGLKGAWSEAQTVIV